MTIKTILFDQGGIYVMGVDYDRTAKALEASGANNAQNLYSKAV